MSNDYTKYIFGSSRRPQLTAVGHVGSCYGWKGSESAIGLSMVDLPSQSPFNLISFDVGHM
jgi:hypothetical protein